MSSDSDNEEFYDACDITPNKSQSSEDILDDRNLHVPTPHQKYIENDVAFSLMPAPKAPLPRPPNYGNTEATSSIQPNVEETSSICSGSLLCNLNVAVEEEYGVPHWRNRRMRNRVRRPKINDDDDDTCAAFPPSSPGESQSSSVDALFPSNQTSAPFRVVEVDATSIYSTTFSQDKGNKPLTKIDVKEDATIPSEQHPSKENSTTDQLSISDDANSDGARNIIPLSPEPDVVASTKSNSLPRNDEPVVEPSNSSSHIITAVTESLLYSAITKEFSIATPGADSVLSGDFSPEIVVVPAILVPIAPPRKNKKRKKRYDDAISITSVTSLPVPPFSLAAKDADGISHHLDLQSASRGEYFVRPLDTEKCRAPRPSDSDLAHIESAEETTSQASTPETSRALSNRLLATDVFLSDKRKDSISKASDIPLKTCNAEPMKSSADKKESECNVPPQVPTRSDTNKELTDEEILRQVTVLNLDTGERIPLSEAEECLPAALNPLSLHIMRLTSEYISSSMEREESDEESIAEITLRKHPETDSLSVKKRSSQLKKFLGKTMESAVNKAKTLAQEVSHRNKEEKDIFEDDAPAQNTMQYVKIKTSHSHKGPHEFDNLMYVQELKGEHIGPVWCMKFSPCGRLLATAGQDHVLRVWVLKQAFNYFLDIRTKWNADVKSSPTPSQESLVSQHSSHSSEDIGTLDPNDDGIAPFMPKPFCMYTGHTADVLDLSWSKNYFMLTSSMDKTVRLWHISRKECLCIFKHVDFVTAIAFHPKDDRYFISGSLDGKLRLWSIPDKQVVMWNEVEGHPKLITAANFCQNGAFTVVGTYNGRCIFYKTEELKYFTQIHVKSSRGKNARGRKITGIEPLPDEDKLMITSNDSRIRLYDLNVLNVSCKYKGYSNVSSQIRAGFSHDGKYIVAGSENQCIYIWKTHHDYAKFSSARKDRNVYWEGVKAHSAVVTCAIFSPRPEHIFNFIEQQELQNKDKEESKSSEGHLQDVRPSSNQETSASNKGYVLVSADFNGCIKVFLKKEKPKHSSLPASALV